MAHLNGTIGHIISDRDRDRYSVEALDGRMLRVRAENLQPLDPEPMLDVFPESDDDYSDLDLDHADTKNGEPTGRKAQAPWFT